MANTASARKSARQSEVRRKRNASLRSSTRSAMKDVQKAVLAGDAAAAATALIDSISKLDRTVAKGVMHRNAASRQKSRLTHAVKALSK
jgi:small subunit ribosomal protein S20